MPKKPPHPQYLLRLFVAMYLESVRVAKQARGVKIKPNGKASKTIIPKK